ncbi:hypothetical protein AKO1_015700 [Acrasis kona]|uniref:Uncharacterized protein n=1 Tax=Acrasis kona TaxID=1008807 RepID=A0AAW2ZT17_9EUKA
MARRKSRATKKTQVKNKAAMNTEKSVDVSEPENYTEKLNKCEHDSTDVLNYTQTLLAAIDRVDITRKTFTGE